MVEKAHTEESLEEFYQWAKGIGHYSATEAVERYRNMLKDVEDEV